MNTLSFRVIAPDERPVVTLVNPDQHVVTAVAELDRVAHELHRAECHIAAAADYLERRRQAGDVDVPELLNAYQQFHATPGFMFGSGHVAISTRAAQFALDRLWEARSGVPARPVRVLTNPSPRKTLEGLGLIAAGVGQTVRGLPDCVRWLNRPGRAQHVTLGSLGLLLAVAAWTALKLGGAL